jgi:ATP-dependent Clp protease ATP-binding subunit ClpA
LAEQASDAVVPTEALRFVRELRMEIDDFERQQVARALAAGEPVTAVARALGVRRQSAHRRFRDLIPARVHARRLAPSPETRLAVQYARDEAEELGADGIGSEHLLLGLLRSGDHPAVQALEELGVNYEAAREECRKRDADTGADGPKPVLAAAARAARAAGASQVGIEHLLDGVLFDAAGGAAQIVQALGVAREAAVRAGAPRPPLSPSQG